MRMSMLVTATSLAITILASMVLTLPAEAQPVSGELRCNIQGGFGVVIPSNRAVTCTYRRAGLPVEFYTGYTETFGLDIGPTNARVVTYKVLAADPALPAALDGNFAGPGFGVAAGAGGGSDALVGGAGGVSLLPIPNTATTSYTGLNINAGINRLHLQFAAVERLTRSDRRRYVPVDAMQ